MQRAARGHILVVDDEAAILSTLKKALSLEGYAVDVAGGVGVAEERLRRGNYDVVLLDVALPDGDGVELLERLRASGNDVVAIMMSGHGTVEAAVRATKLGACDFLEKPLSSDRLLLVVDNALRLLRAEAEATELKTLAGHFDELRRYPVQGGPAEVVEYTLSWTENGVPHAGHHLHLLTVRDDRIVSDMVFCGGRWPAALLAEMEAAGA